MVIVRLMGGLGNQMFQYALGRHLALRLKTRLKLDLSFLLDKTPRENLTIREYELGVFSFNQDFATAEETKRFSTQVEKAGIGKRIYSVLSHFSDRFKPYRTIREKSFRFDQSVLARKGNLYLDGFWQSEKYFAGIAHVLREDLEFKFGLQGVNKDIAEEIRRKNAVSLHIRRGDYVQNPSTNAYHGVCSPAYYHQAVDLIAAKVNKPYFFIFSDEIAWAKENLSLPFGCNYVTHNTGSKCFEDMRLMSLCQHHIIANSSFSWWGAWLNPNSEKLVIAPAQWFNEPGIDTADLLPEDWLKLQR